eukprot:4861991-Amphidinium_carterae.1
MALMGPNALTFVCGVPVPPRLSEQASILDVFLCSAVQHFECFLLGPLKDAKTAGRGETESLAVPGAQSSCGEAAEYMEALGFSHRVATRCGLTLGQMADGIWLLLHHSQTPPEWCTIAAHLTAHDLRAELAYVQFAREEVRTQMTKIMVPEVLQLVQKINYPTCSWVVFCSIVFPCKWNSDH